MNIKNPKQGQKERLRRWKGEIKRREKEKKSVEEIEEVKKKTKKQKQAEIVGDRDRKSPVVKRQFLFTSTTLYRFTIKHNYHGKKEFLSFILLVKDIALMMTPKVRFP